jgi:hypothetical protein
MVRAEIAAKPVDLDEVTIMLSLWQGKRNCSTMPFSGVVLKDFLSAISGNQR